MAESIGKRKNDADENAVISKKQSLESPPPEQPTEFLSLNDDCIFKVFEFLPLNDLYSMKRVCKRLFDLTSNQFERQYKGKWIYLKETGRGHFAERKLREIFQKEHFEYCCQSVFCQRRRCPGIILFIAFWIQENWVHWLHCGQDVQWLCERSSQKSRIDLF